MFFVKHDVPGTRYPLNLAISIGHAAAGKTTVLIESKQLNSSFATLDGYWEPFFVEAPALVFDGRDGQGTYRVDVYDHILGANAMLAPWRSNAVALPAGRYRVRLTAERVGRVWALHDRAGLWATGSRRKVDVTLSDDYAVPLR